MAKTAFVRVRVEPKLKISAETVLDELGMSPSQAITMLYKYLMREHKWPITTKIPNDKTIKTFKDSDNQTNLTISSSTKEMFDKLGI